LIFKYRPEVFDAIVVTLIENGKEIANKVLYQAVTVRLGFNLSNRDYSSHLLNMEKEGFISKQRKRRKMMYDLTKMAESAHKLNILGRDNNKERLCRLYQFLFLASCLQRTKQISETELDNLMRYYGARREKLVQESRIHVIGTNFYETVYSQVSSLTISTIELEEVGRSTTINYYFQEESFSVREMRSFVTSGLRSYPIFVADLRYIDSDIPNAIRLLSENEIISFASSYSKDETKFSVRGDFLQKMRDLIWVIHSLEMYYLSLSGSSCELTEHEKEGMKLLFGKIEGYKLIKLSSRRKRADQRILCARDLDILRDTVDAIVDTKVKELYENYGQLVNENYLYNDLLKKILIRKRNIVLPIENSRQYE
jgi:hypothetical protein